MSPSILFLVFMLFFGALIFFMIGGFIIICVRQKWCILKYVFLI
jgi:hypothetical protein